MQTAPPSHLTIHKSQLYKNLHLDILCSMVSCCKKNRAIWDVQYSYINAYNKAQGFPQFYYSIFIYLSLHLHYNVFHFFHAHTNNVDVKLATVSCSKIFPNRSLSKRKQTDILKKYAIHSIYTDCKRLIPKWFCKHTIEFPKSKFFEFTQD